jgi:predicted TIM-barrel fold metal-dependent hydrolase
MRINCHAHIFNGTAVFTSHTLQILLNRITDMEIPDLIKNELVKQLGSLFKKAGAYVDEETLFRNVVQKVSKSADFNKMLNNLSPGDTLRMQFSGGAALEDYAVEGLVTLLGRVAEVLDQENKDAGKADILDALSFLRIALLPDIRHVTDNLMEQLTLQDAAVALTMDITNDGSNPKLFEKQLAATSAQVLAYPGRLFPFVAVNTRRPEHFDIMERALTGRGFVGVKLYPSLGFAIDSPETDKVYGYCEERGIPLLMHCSEGGFYYSNATRKNSDPSLWGAILGRHPNMKICFGHFGGAKYLSSTQIPDPCWTRTILDLMEKYAGVYADISYHSEPMEGGDVEKHYFANISELLNNDAYRRRILFGTDFFLVRQRLTEKNYWKYFRSRLSEQEFRQICEENPCEFLGLPAAGRQAGLPIQNYVRFVYQQRDSLLAEAPGWLKSAIKEMYGPSAKLPKPSLGPLWSWNNKVHAYLYVFLAEGQLSERQKQKGFEAAGLYKLRDMAYWNKGFEPREIWERKLKAMAENLDTFLRTNGGSYEKGQTDRKAMGALVKLFDNGSRYIHEVGEGCDAIYRF